LIEAVSIKRLGLEDVEADIIGKSYEYLIRKFAEGGGQSAGEFYTPPEVGTIMSKVLQPEPGMEIYDPTCGSGGLLVKCEIAMEDAAKGKRNTVAPLKLYGQEYTPETWAMANMNMIIHDMEGQIEIGDTFKNPKFRSKGKLRTFDRAIANPMWNQDWFTEADYDADELDRFAAEAGFPGKSSADWDGLNTSTPRSNLEVAQPSFGILEPLRVVQVMRATIRRRTSDSGSSIKTSLRACSTYLKISSITPAPLASCSS
jgi:type I restriction enzyme M protein